jgi:hypothetical protein
MSLLSAAKTRRLGYLLINTYYLLAGAATYWLHYKIAGKWYALVYAVVVATTTIILCAACSNVAAFVCKIILLQRQFPQAHN